MELGKRALVYHTPVIGCFVCPVLCRRRTLSKAIGILAEAANVVLGTCKHSCQERQPIEKG